MSYEQDYILRLAKQIAQVLARALGLAEAQAPRQALDEIDRAYSELFGFPPGLVDSFDGASLVRLVGDPLRCGQLARLVEEEARLYDRIGQPDRAAEKRAVAAALHDAAGTQSASLSATPAVTPVTSPSEKPN